MCEQRVSVTDVDEWNHHSVPSLGNKVQTRRTGRERKKKKKKRNNLHAGLLVLREKKKVLKVKKVMC